MNLRTIKLTSQQQLELKHGYEKGKPGAFRKRCHAILLKSEGRSSQDVGRILDMHEVSVNNWLSRYEEQGITGLITKPGRGRKMILDRQTDEQKVRAIVRQERQRLKLAKEALEKELGKSFSIKTLKRFLKNVSANGNA